MRDLVHRREIICQSYRLDHGLWEIEARMADTKAYDIPSHDRGEIKAGEPVHDMRVRVVIDGGYRVQEVEVVMAATPFHFCPAIAPDFSDVKGTVIGKGWHKEIVRRFGGTRGCTHVVELFRTVATVAYQTLANLRHEAEPLHERPAHIGGCHALKADGPVVQWLHPEWYEGKEDNK